MRLSLVIKALCTWFDALTGAQRSLPIPSEWQDCSETLAQTCRMVPLRLCTAQPPQGGSGQIQLLLDSSSRSLWYETVIGSSPIFKLTSNIAAGNVLYSFLIAGLYPGSGLQVAT